MTVAAHATNGLRIPPHNLDAERAVLGAMLFAAADAVPRVVDVLRPSDFYTEAHRTIYQPMVALFERGEPVDSLTPTEELRRLNQLAFVGGPAALAVLMEEASIAVHLGAYVALVRDLAVKREAIQVAMKVIRRAFEDTVTVPELVTILEDVLGALTERAAEFGRPAGPQPIAKVLEGVMTTLDAPEADVVPTAVPELNDRLGGGTMRAEVVILGGRPGVAKTALALQWAALAAERGHRTIVFSREMQALALGRRILAPQAQVAASALRKRDVDATERQRLLRALPRLGRLPLWFDDASTTIGQIRRVARAGDYRFVIVDYLQLVRAPGVENRRLEVTAVSAGLKNLAMRTGCSILALSSLTRLQVERGGKRLPPALDNLKESGDLEADADVVVLLHQPDPDKRDRELIFAKLRGGESGGKVTLAWDPVYVRFTEVPSPFAADEPGADDVPF